MCRSCGVLCVEVWKQAYQAGQQSSRAALRSSREGEGEWAEALLWSSRTAPSATWIARRRYIGSRAASGRRGAPESVRCAGSGTPGCRTQLRGWAVQSRCRLWWRIERGCRWWSTLEALSGTWHARPVPHPVPSGTSLSSVKFYHYFGYFDPIKILFDGYKWLMFRGMLAMFRLQQ